MSVICSPSSVGMRLTVAFSNPTDYVPPEDTFSPVLHRIDQVVRWRAIHPDTPIPPVYDILTKYSQPPQELVEKAQESLDKLLEASNVKKGKLTRAHCQFHRNYTNPNITVPPKVRGKREREQPTPMSGLNVRK